MLQADLEWSCRNYIEDWTVNWPINWRRTRVAATLLAITDVNRDMHVAAPEDDDLIYGARPFLRFSNIRKRRKTKRIRTEKEDTIQKKLTEAEEA